MKKYREKAARILLDMAQGTNADRVDRIGACKVILECTSMEFDVDRQQAGFETIPANGVADRNFGGET